MTQTHTYNPVTEEVLAALRAALGEEFVKNDPETLERYKTDEEPDPHYHHLPEVVVLPGNTEEVAAVMKLANKFLVQVPVYLVVQFLFAAALCFCWNVWIKFWK